MGYITRNENVLPNHVVNALRIGGMLGLAVHKRGHESLSDWIC